MTDTSNGPANGLVDAGVRVAPLDLTDLGEAECLLTSIIGMATVIAESTQAVLEPLSGAATGIVQLAELARKKVGRGHDAAFKAAHESAGDPQ